MCTYDTQTLLDTSFAVAAGTPRVVGPYPAGTKCVVTEVGTGGANSTVLDPTNGEVVIVAGDGEVGNVEVIATNTFDVGSVVVSKVLVGAIDVPGPFTVDLTCTRRVDGTPQQIVIPGGAERTLSAPDALTTTYSDLPAGAACTLTETTTGGAISTSMSVTMSLGAVVTAGTSATFTVLAQSLATVRVTITNTFDQGSGVPGVPSVPGNPDGGANLPPTGGGTPLPSTGGDIGQSLVLAAALMGLGAMLLVSRRKLRIA